MSLSIAHLYPGCGCSECGVLLVWLCCVDGRIWEHWNTFKSVHLMLRLLAKHAVCIFVFLFVLMRRNCFAGKAYVPVHVAVDRL